MVVINIFDDVKLDNVFEWFWLLIQDVDMLVFLGYGSQLNKVFLGVDVGGVLFLQIIDLGNIFVLKGEGFIVWKEVINLCVVVLIIKELFNGNFVIVGC